MYQPREIRTSYRVKGFEVTRKVPCRTGFAQKSLFMHPVEARPLETTTSGITIHIYAYSLSHYTKKHYVKKN